MSFFTNIDLKSKKLKKKDVLEGIYLANAYNENSGKKFFQQNDKDDSYLVQIIFEYNIEINAEKLFEAWKKAKKRFSSLRSRFSWDNKLLLIIDKYDEKIDFCKYIELDSNLIEDEQNLFIKNIQKEDRLNLYKLDEGNLLRIFLIKKKSDKFVCLFSHHHSILDGWSIDILLNFVNETYLNLINNQINDEQQYNDIDFKNVQNYLQSSLNSDYEYWNNKIENVEEKNDLKILLSNKNKEDIKYFKNVKNQNFKISDDKYDKLKQLTSSYGLTSNAIFQFIWHKIFSIYSNTKKTIIGTTISGRNIPINNIENTVGCFINTLPLIVNHLDKNDNIINKIKEIQDSINELNMHGNVKLSKIQKNAESLFDVLLVFENYPEIKNEKLDQLNIKLLETIEKLDYNFYITILEEKTASSISININYTSDLFDDNLIKDLILLFEKLLLQIISNPNQNISNLEYLVTYQKEKIFNEWNNTEKYYPEDKLLNELFEETVNNYPENISIIFGDIQLTYKELNEKANKFSNYLRNNYEIKPDDLIALCIDRSELMIITILAVWKSGAAYVPIDPNFPDQRIEYILNDTKCKIILSNEIYSEKIKNLNTNQMKIICIDSQNLVNELENFSPVNNKNQTKSNNLAYIIYTSGTTGLPKGVMIEHKSVIAYDYSQFKNYYQAGKTILQYSSCKLRFYVSLHI
jgi:hypothetical protein